MNKALFFSLLILTATCSFAQQPNQSLHFLNAKPEWSHISFYNAFSDPRTIPRLVKDPIISDSAIYLVTDLCYSHCYGYGIEKLDARNGKEIWKDYYYSEIKNERKAPVNVSLKNDEVEILLMKENDKSNFPYLAWFKSNINAVKYCSTGEKCDSLITSPNDSLNIQTEMYVDFKGTKAGSFASKQNDTTLYVRYRSISQKFNLIVQRLDNKGHRIDSMKTILPLFAKNARIFNYQSGKYFAMISTESDSFSQCFLAYFNKNFVLEKWIDISKHFKMNIGSTFVPYYDENRIVLGRFLGNVEIDNQLKDYYSFVMVNHKGELLDKMEEVLVTPLSDCIALPIGIENKLMVLNSELNKKAINVFSGANKLEKTLKLSSKTYLYDAYPMPNNQIMLDLVYFDTLANKKTNVVKQFSLLNLAELGFITKVENASPSSFKFYPNPAKDQITIATDVEYDGVKIFSIDGKIIYNLKKAHNSIDINILPSGMYFIELWNQTKPITRKEKLIKIQ
jgi:hypothetical protein